jgi:hypothetical protein
VHVQRVRGWRERNPGYWRRPRASRGPEAAPPGAALQDALDAQPIDPAEAPGSAAGDALQDALRSHELILIGLIAHLTDTTLQDAVLLTSQRLLELGHDILRARGPDEPEASAAS